MSNIAMQGGATGTGTVTLLAPSTSTNRTLTLPDATGTVTTSEAVTAAGYTTPAAVLTQFNASGSAPVYACRAWVNFNGTGTVAIRASGNVSSITDGGVGIYTANFTNVMPDANYATVGISGLPGSDGSCVVDVYTSSASAKQIQTRTAPQGSVYDSSYVNLAFFR